VGYEGINLLDKTRPARLEFSRMLFSTDTAGGLKVGENCQRWEKLIQGELFEQHQEQFMYKNAKALLERIGAI